MVWVLRLHLGGGACDKCDDEGMWGTRMCYRGCVVLV